MTGELWHMVDPSEAGKDCILKELANSPNFVTVPKDEWSNRWHLGLVP